MDGIPRFYNPHIPGKFFSRFRFCNDNCCRLLNGIDVLDGAVVEMRVCDQYDIGRGWIAEFKRINDDGFIAGLDGKPVF